MQQLYTVIKSNPYLSRIAGIGPMPLENAERMAVRMTMCESNPNVKYHAVPTTDGASQYAWYTHKFNAHLIARMVWKLQYGITKN